MTTLIAAIGGFIFGYDTGVIAGALLFIAPEFSTTSVSEGWITAVLVLGAAVGAMTGARIADSIGRSRTLIGAGLLFSIAGVICAIAPNLHILAIGRALGGVAVGACSIVVPMYISERVAPEHRGKLVSLNSLMIVIGQLSAFIVNSLLAHTGSWRIMLAMTIIPGILLAIGMFFQPDSVSKKEKTTEKKTGEYKEALKIPWIRRACLIAITVGIIQQITGVNAIMYFVPTMMNRAGLSVEVSVYSSIIIGVVSVIACFIGLQLVDRVGRRSLLSVGLAGTSICLIFVAFLSHNALLSLIFMSLFIAFQQSAVSVVTWLLLSEIVPARVRAFGMGVAGLALWVANFLVAQSFLPLLDVLGSTTTFLFFALLGALSFLFIRLFVPETAGRSLEEVEELMRSSKKGLDKSSLLG